MMAEKKSRTKAAKAPEKAASPKKGKVAPGQVAICDEPDGRFVLIGLGEDEADGIASRKELEAACADARKAAESAEQAGQNSAVIHELISREAENAKKLLEEAGVTKEAAENAAKEAESRGREWEKRMEAALAEAKEAADKAMKAAEEAAASAAAAKEGLAEFQDAVKAFKSGMLGMLGKEG